MDESDDIGSSARTAARDWVQRLASGEIDAEEIEALKAWLASDVHHARAFERERAFWQDMEPHRALFAQPEPSFARRRRRASAWAYKPSRRFVASAAAACLVLLAGAPSLMLHLRADHVAGAGQIETVTLPDRSTAMLDAGAAIAVHYADGKRHIELLRGRAWFKVAHADTRPFTVGAHSGIIEDVGTAFEVSRIEQRAEVGVSDGEVRLHSAPGDGAITLKAGQRARYGYGKAERLPSIATDRIAAWRDGELLIDDMTMPDAIAEVSRYRKGYTFVWAKMDGRPGVSGVFSTAHPDDALAALAMRAKLQLVYLPGGIVIVR